MHLWLVLLYVAASLNPTYTFGKRSDSGNSLGLPKDPQESDSQVDFTQIATSVAVALALLSMYSLQSWIRESKMIWSKLQSPKAQIVSHLKVVKSQNDGLSILYARALAQTQRQGHAKVDNPNMRSHLVFALAGSWHSAICSEWKSRVSEGVQQQGSQN